MTHQEHQALETRVERIENRPVTRVRELASRGRHRNPADLIDFLVRLERAVANGHRPVADTLVAAPPVAIPAGAELGAEKTLEARLLGDLAEGALLVVLPGLDLALRQGPVLVTRPMDEEDLDLRSGAGADDRSARRPDLGR